jgi:hypothetical protein
MSVFHPNRHPEFVSKYSLGKKQTIAYTLTESPTTAATAPGSSILWFSLSNHKETEHVKH